MASPEQGPSIRERFGKALPWVIAGVFGIGVVIYLAQAGLTTPNAPLLKAA